MGILNGARLRRYFCPWALSAQKRPVVSAVSFVLNDTRVDFHRTHPDKEALRYRMKDARKFLENAGITL